MSQLRHSSIAIALFVVFVMLSSPCLAATRILSLYDGSASTYVASKVSAGKSVSVQAVIPATAGFNGWQIHTGLDLSQDQVASPAMTFTMPDCNVTLGASFGTATFLAGPSLDDIPAYMAGTQELVVAPQSGESTFALSTNTYWTAKVLATDGTSASWLTLPETSGFGASTLRFQTAEYHVQTSQDATAAMSSRSATIRITSASTAVSAIQINVTQLPPDTAGGFYYDTWNGSAYLNLVIQADSPEESVVIPSYTDDGRAVTGIGSNAFSDNAALQSVTFEHGTTVIGAGAFQNCSALAAITFPETLAAIRTGAFENCANLTAADLEATSLKTIGDCAFKNCTQLKSATFPTHLTTIGDQAFHGCASLQPGILPRYLESIGNGAFTLTGTRAFEVNPYNTTFRALDGVLFTRSDYTLVAYPTGATATHYTIHETTRTIGPGAFSNCTQLTSICMTDAESLTEIHDEAFQNATGLTHLQLPFAIATIGNRAFAGCSNLQSIYAADTQPAIATSAFQDCTKLTRFYFYGGKPAFDSTQELAPASKKAIYACRDYGWTNGETYAGCTVNTAAAADLHGVAVTNGMPLTYAAPNWPVAAMAFPSDTMIFSQWTTVRGTTFTAEQQSANPVEFVMPKNSSVSLAASYVQPSFQLTLTHAKLSTGATGGTFAANTPLRAIAAVPSGASFACWMSDTLSLDDDGRKRQYLDFLMPFCDTALHAAVTVANIPGAVGYNSPFISYGDAFWDKSSSDAKSAPASAATSGKHSYLATSVTGPGYFTFYAKVTSPSTSAATLSCALDSQEPTVTLTAADAAWTPCSIYVPAETHTIQWLLDNPDGDATSAIDSACLYASTQLRYLKVVNSSGSGYYSPGSLVTLTADSIIGKGFETWNAPTLELTPEEQLYPVLTFIMPNRDTQITAEYEPALLGIGPAETAAVATESAAFTCTADALTRQMTLYANAPWTATADADWLAITPAQGLVSTDAAISIQTNTTAERKANIVIEAENGERLVLAITQHQPNATGFLYDAWDGDAVITQYVPDHAITQLDIPSDLDGFTVTDIEPGALKLCKYVSRYTADIANRAVAAQDGILYTPDMATLIAYPPCAQRQDFTLPDSVTTIDDYAFSNCTTLQTLTLSDLIQPCTFATDALENCTDAIAAFATHPTNTTLLALNGILFSQNLETLIAYPPGNTQPAYTLPSATRTVAARAFNNARHLNMLTFPATITAFGSRPFKNLEGCLRFLVFHGDKPEFADDDALPPNATIYIHTNTLPANAWESFIQHQGNDIAYFQDDAALAVVSSPDFISYDGQYSITIEVSCSTGTWRIFRESLGENDAVWMPCDISRDATWITLDWYLEQYPVNSTAQNRSQTLWITADGCAPAVITLTQLCKNETLTQNFGELPIGWNALPILCNPFPDSVQYLVNQDAFVFEKHRLVLRRASTADIIGGARIWLYITEQLQRTLPYFPITGQVIHEQTLPATRGWHAVGIAVPQGFDPEEWTAIYNGVWQWDGTQFIAIDKSKSLIYGNSYWVHKP